MNLSKVVIVLSVFKLAQHLNFVHNTLVSAYINNKIGFSSHGKYEQTLSRAQIFWKTQPFKYVGIRFHMTFIEVDMDMSVKTTTSLSEVIHVILPTGSLLSC